MGSVGSGGNKEISGKLLEELSAVKVSGDQRLNSAELEYTLKLGAGASGKVYKGMYLIVHLP